MSYRREREEFLSQFARFFPKGAHSVALALLRESSAEQRYNEIASSIDVGERELARLERRSNARLLRVRAIAERLGGKLSENGDPRGCAFTIITPDGREIGIPGRGLPASAFR